MAQNDAAERVKEPAVAQQQNQSPFGIWNRESAGSKGFKVLLYGESGSGKTYMAGTFPDPLFLDLEGGMRTLLYTNRKILRYPKNPDEVVTEWQQVKAFWQMIKKIPPAQAPFKTIVIDSLNELQNLVLKNLVAQFDANRQYEDQPTMADYGKLARDMQAIVRDFVQLPYNIVMIAAATDREYEDDKVIPMFIGKKTGPDLRRIIEQVGYCYTSQKTKDAPVEHLVSFANNPLYLAKDRTTKLNRPIPNSYQAIEAALAK